MAELKPRMSDREAEAFETVARSATSYFEFGIGGSTYVAGQVVKGRVVAIDSDPDWIEKARSALEESPFERRLVHIDIGKTKTWGYPVDTKNPDKFRAYHQSIQAFTPEDFDFCLVDGRFRVACFLSALKYTRPDTILAIHDYRSRADYHVAEEFGRIVLEVEDISFFVRRRGVGLQALEAAIEAYAAVTL